MNLQAPRSLTGPGVQEELADGAAQRVFAGETSYPDRRVGDGIAGGTVNDPTRNPERSLQPKIDDPRARNGVSGSGVRPGSPGEGTVPALQFVTGLGAGDVFSGGDLALFVGYGQGRPGFASAATTLASAVGMRKRATPWASVLAEARWKRVWRRFRSSPEADRS